MREGEYHCIRDAIATEAIFWKGPEEGIRSVRIAVLEQGQAVLFILKVYNPNVGLL